MSAKTNVIAIAKPSDPAEALRRERARISRSRASLRRLAGLRRLREQSEEENAFQGDRRAWGAGDRLRPGLGGWRG